jgi:ABC-type proline/glycine betaine transport system permease subunit
MKVMTNLPLAKHPVSHIQVVQLGTGIERWFALPVAVVVDRQREADPWNRLLVKHHVIGMKVMTNLPLAKHPVSHIQVVQLGTGIERWFALPVAVVVDRQREADPWNRQLYLR